MPLLWFSSRKKLEEKAWREAKKVVKKDMPRMRGEIDTGVLYAIHMSRDGRSIIEKLGRNDVSVGFRQALLAKMFRFRYLPEGSEAYSVTRDALMNVIGGDVDNPKELYKMMNEIQNWEAHTAIPYEGGFYTSKTIPTPSASAVQTVTNLLKLDGYEYGKLWMDMNNIREVSVAGYILAAMNLEKLNKADKVLMVSTLHVLRDRLYLKQLGEKAGIYVYDGERKTIVRGKIRERGDIIYDGYLKTRFLDPGFQKFDTEVEKLIEKATEKDPEIRGYARKIWEHVKGAVHAFAPAWYNFMAFDAEAYLPKHIADTVVEIAKMYKKFSKIPRNPFKYAGKDVREIMDIVAEALNIDKDSKMLKREVWNLLKYVAGVTPGDPTPRPDVKRFAYSRIPYLIYRVGQRIGAGFDLEKIYDYLSNDKYATALSKKLLKYGIIISPVDMKNVLTGEFESVKLYRMMYWKEYVALNSAYTFYYSMGIPITRVFMSGGRVVSTTNLKYMFEDEEILNTRIEFTIPSKILRRKNMNEDAVLPKIKVSTSIGREVFKAFDKAIRNHLLVALMEAETHKRKLSPTDPRLYQSILYIFSDIKLLKDEKNTETIQVKLASAIESTISNLLYVKFREAEIQGEVAKALKKEKMTKKLAEYVKETLAALSTVEGLSETILSMGKHSTYKHIGIISKRSENIYKNVLEVIETGESAGIEREEMKRGKELPPEISRIPENSPLRISYELTRILPIIEIANNLRRFQIEWQRKKEKKRGGYGELEGIEYVLAPSPEELRRLEEQLRKGEERKKREEEEKPKPQPTPTTKKPQPETKPPKETAEKIGEAVPTEKQPEERKSQGEVKQTTLAPEPRRKGEEKKTVEGEEVKK